VRVVRTEKERKKGEKMFEISPSPTQYYYPKS
jgi:hypothetical protein